MGRIMVVYTHQVSHFVYSRGLWKGGGLGRRMVVCAYLVVLQVEVGLCRGLHVSFSCVVVGWPFVLRLFPCLQDIFMNPFIYFIILFF